MNKVLARDLESNLTQAQLATLSTVYTNAIEVAGDLDAISTLLQGYKPGHYGPSCLENLGYLLERLGKRVLSDVANVVDQLEVDARTKTKGTQWTATQIANF